MFSSGLSGFPGLVLVDSVFLPDIPGICEDDALIDPLQLSDPTVSKPYLPAQLCLVGRLTLSSDISMASPLGCILLPVFLGPVLSTGSLSGPRAHPPLSPSAMH